jgi:hypothetical protein
MARDAASQRVRSGAVFSRGRVSPALRARHRAGRLAAWALFGALSGGCLYDAEDRCSPGQVLQDDILCLCGEGSVLGETGCTPCGENEVAGGSACVCAPGFSRATADAPCSVTPSALGAACDTASMPCSDEVYGVCQPADGSAGYCTEACTSSDDCEGGYACDTVATPPYCRRPPSGAGRACATNADCADAEASLCEAFMLHECVVVCDVAAPDCFPGTQCCDFTGFGAPAPFCLPRGAC